MRRWRPLALIMLLAACDPQAGAPEAEPPIPGADAITTTALDAPASGAAVAPVAAPARPADLDVPIAAIAALPGPAALEDPAAAPGPDPAIEEPTPIPAEPARVLSAAEAACVARGGAYSSTPDGGVMACVRRTRDSGKQCRKATDCQGECLARSRTCAPIDPLLGCNDILQNDGVRVTLCLD